MVDQTLPIADEVLRPWYVGSLCALGALKALRALGLFVEGILFLAKPSWLVIDDDGIADETTRTVGRPGPVDVDRQFEKLNEDESTGESDTAKAPDE